MLFTQSIRWVVQVVIVTYQFAGEDAYLSCTVEKDGNTVKEMDECFVDYSAVSRILSVTTICPDGVCEWSNNDQSLHIYSFIHGLDGLKNQ